MTQPFDNRDWDLLQIKQKDAEIERLKALLGRTADALEFWMKDLASTQQQYVDAAMRDERLLAELRKAAK